MLENPYQSPEAGGERPKRRTAYWIGSILILLAAMIGARVLHLRLTVDLDGISNEFFREEFIKRGWILLGISGVLALSGLVIIAASWRKALRQSHRS